MRIRNEIKAGLFMSIGLFLIASLIIIMGREKQIFARQSKFYATFSDVKGLSSGAPVRLGGIPIGRVSEVGFSRDLSDLRVHVTLLINDAYLERMRPDSTVAIDTQGLLGDKFVSISPGETVGSIAPGSILPSTETGDFQRVLVRAQAAVDSSAQITERINKSLEGLSPDTFTNIADATKSMADVLAAIKREKGFVNRLIYSEQDGKKLMDSINATSRDLSAIVGEVKTGKGLLHALVYEESGKDAVGELLKASQGVSRASNSLADILNAARNGKGLLHDVVYTEVTPGTVAKRVEAILLSLSESATNLKVATDAMANGTGTLGALLVDPRLYDNLIEITDGAKRSFILRQAVRSSLSQ
jgi:phospholipid/cholesterol/gamma-HCH transport system substrate-binding protein